VLATLPLSTPLKTWPLKTWPLKTWPLKTWPLSTPLKTWPLKLESGMIASGVAGALHGFGRTFTPYPISEPGAGYTRSLARLQVFEQGVMG
jgi:hypothetical protein